MACSQLHLIFSFASEAKNPATYSRAKDALRALLQEGGLCPSHQKLAETILSSDEAFQPLFQKALEQFVAIHRIELFFTNIAMAQQRGGAFIKMVEEQYPGNPAELADRIFDAAEGNPEAMQLVALYGRTEAEIDSGTIW
jgi:hypothetical protein